MTLIRDKKIPIPKYLLDLNPLRKDLSYVRFEEGRVKIGALTTLYEISKSILHRDIRYAGFVDTWSKFGTMALRFTATIGGNIATATQYSDYITLLLTYDTSIRTIGVRGERLVKLEDFVVDVRKTLMEPDEIVKEIEFREPPLKTSSVFIKFDRRNLLIAGIITSALYMTLEENVIKDIRVSYDMVRDKKIPGRAREVEDYLRDRALDEKVVEEAVNEILPKTMHRVTDWWTTAEYRLEMSKLALRRGIFTVKERIEKGYG